MVSGAKIDGAQQILSAGVRKTIHQIKEIVGNHSDADIYAALKETNMDPNEAAQKLLNQDPFREVRRKKDKKKENAGSRASTSAEPRKPSTSAEPRKPSTSAEPRKASTSAEPRKNFEHATPATRTGPHSDPSVRKTASIHSTLPGVSREFRVVRDNRINHSSNRESNPVLSSDPISELAVRKAYVKSGSPGTSMNENLTFGRTERTLNGTAADSRPRQLRVGNTNMTQQFDLNTAAAITPAAKPPSTASSTNSVIGVYSSSSDPVHVPSPDSRPAAAKIGAIKREVGANRQNSENYNLSSSPGNNTSNSRLARDGTSPRESLRTSDTIGKNEQSSQNIMPESTVPSQSVNRSFSNNQHNGRSHHLTGQHQKAAQPNKEWKPKSSQKVGAAKGPGVIGTPAKTSSPMDNTEVGTEVAQVNDQFSRVNISENQNVIIASHIRVSETDRSRLTFGSLGTVVESITFAFQAAGSSNEPYAEASECLPVSSVPEPSFEPANEKELDVIDNSAQNSGSGSPASVSASEHRIKEKKEVSTPENVENYVGHQLVRASSPSYVSPVVQQQQESIEMPSFSSYDPQTGYDVPYFRPVVDEPVRGQGMAPPQEALISHATNTIPSSSMAMLQQQQALAQMYQQHQLQLSPYSNMMPYRQFISPLYVPPMPVPGYSGNAPYPHPSNGNGYVLMAGSSSHLNSSGGPKYAIQQFKPIQTGSPAVFGNFASPNGYAVNTPGVLGNPAGLEDSSRLKYKDGNLYVPSPQAETSEIWMNTRDIQSGPYYNVPGQTPHPAYISAHNNHSFNAAHVAQQQSSQMPLPAFYHHQHQQQPPPPQPAGMAANPHHFGPTIGGGNVGMGVAAAAPGAQGGSYQQQPQIGGHQNWTGNF